MKGNYHPNAKTNIDIRTKFHAKIDRKHTFFYFPCMQTAYYFWIITFRWMIAFAERIAMEYIPLA